MGNQMKFKKRVSGYFEAPMRLGFFLLLINILILFMHWPSGLVLLVFTICYFVVVLALRMHSRALVINEMVSFATEYGQVQKRLLKNLELRTAFWMIQGGLSGPTTNLTVLCTRKRQRAGRSAPFSLL